MGRSGPDYRGELVSGYSCMGVCCSISRQALILRRRQTQQSGSLAAKTMVSAPQTAHLAAFFRRSGEIDCFACSNSLGWNHRLDFCWQFTSHLEPSLLSL